MIYVKDLIEWINKSGLKANDTVCIDGDGETLMADSVKQMGSQAGTPFSAYLWVGDALSTAVDGPGIPLDNAES